MSANPFRRRLTHPDHFRAARSPSAFAPRAADVLTFVPDPPADLLKAVAAKDLEYAGGDLVACSLSGRAWIAHGAKLVAAFPKLTRVRLVAIRPFVSELVACDHNRRLTVLDLRGNRIDPRAVAGIAVAVL